MGWARAIRAVIGRSTDFAGRSSRAEAWLWVLFLVLVHLVCALVDWRLLGTESVRTGNIGIVGALFALATLLPSVAIAFRRVHDIGLSGWWLLLVLIPVAGVIAALVFLLRPGQAGANRYGPDPRAPAPDAAA